MRDRRLPGVITPGRIERPAFLESDLAGQFVPDSIRWRDESRKTTQEHFAQ